MIDEQQKARTVKAIDTLGSNKPVLPTATNGLDADSPGPLRRQTGQPFGRSAGKLREAQSEAGGCFIEGKSI